jgi:hypothetical protein
MLKRLISDADAFWPEYIAHHRHRANRAMHDFADLVVLTSLVTGTLTGHPWFLAIGTTLGYAIVFASHFGIEKNRPATLGHPVLAGLCNWRMFGLMLLGRLDAEYDRFGISQYGSAPWGLDALRRRLTLALR